MSVFVARSRHKNAGERHREGVCRLGGPWEGEGGSASRRACRGRRADRAARRGGGAPAVGRMALPCRGGRRRGGCRPPARAGVGAGGDEGRAATAHRPGPGGRLRATRAAGRGGYTPGRGGAGWAHARPARRERDRRPGPPPWRAGGGGCARGGGHLGPGTARRALGRAPSAGRSPPSRGSRPPRAASERGVPDAPARATVRASAARGPEPAPGRTDGRAASRFGPRRRHRRGQGRGRAAGRPGDG
jgi:hypothetical protein